MSKGVQYTCEITIHRATQVAVGDINTFSSDPYVLASLQVGLDGNVPPQTLTYRTKTIRRSLEPVFNCKWIVSGIPASGFTLTLRLRDEDPGEFLSDDRLGKAFVRIPDRGDKLTEGWVSEEKEYKVEKRRGSLHNHVATYIATVLTRGRIGHSTRIWVSVRVLGEGEERSKRCQKAYTVGPHTYVQHSSPMIGRLVKASKSDMDSTQASGSSEKKLTTTSFIANRLQLTGPVPPCLRNHYVGYRPFIKSMFKKSGIKGTVLNYGLHHQYQTIYKYDKTTVWGIVEDDEDGRAFAQQFLRMTSHGSQGRLFTYVITLDGEMRFTETGEEFAIGMLSKHSMHADVAKEISWSGEFFVRKYGQPESENEGVTDDDAENAEEDPKGYELVIDNDSGTYRPRKNLLSTLEKWLSSNSNFGGLGKVTTIDCFDETLIEWKCERKELKQRARGHMTHGGKGGDEEEVNGRAMPKLTPARKGGSVSSLSSGALGSNASSASSEQMREALEEDERRAKDNQDDPEEVPAVVG